MAIAKANAPTSRGLKAAPHGENLSKKRLGEQVQITRSSSRDLRT